MPDVLALCEGLPTRAVPRGEPLLEEGVPVGQMFVLVHGAFEVVRAGVKVVSVEEPGAFLGEISALLGSAPTADVIAARDSLVFVIDEAQAAAQRDPRLTYAVAQLLARRLQAVTSYLVDIKRQYGASGTHLGLMDRVLSNLMSLQLQAASAAMRAGSERADVPDY